MSGASKGTKGERSETGSDRTNGAKKRAERRTDAERWGYGRRKDGASTVKRPVSDRTPLLHPSLTSLVPFILSSFFLQSSRHERV